MIEQIVLVWQFLLAQSPTAVVRLVSWHLLAVLLVLGVLAGFGLHFLLGHGLRFYRRKDRLARWVSLPTLLVLQASVLALLGAYLLTVQASALVNANLGGGVTARMGQLLLAPAFAGAPLTGMHPDEVPKEAIRTALRGVSELEYRERLAAGIVPVEQLWPSSGERATSGSEVLVQMGLRWITEPHNAWVAPFGSGPPRAETPPAETPRAETPRAETPRADAPRGEAPGDAGAQGEAPFFLPDFLGGLIDELQAGTVLPRLDWEHVAGTRYVEGVLRPLVEEYLTYLAVALTGLVLLLDALYLLLMRRLKRIGMPRAPKRAPAPSAAASSVPVSSVPVPAKPAATGVPIATGSAPAATPTLATPATTTTPSQGNPPPQGSPPPEDPAPANPAAAGKSTA